MRHLALAIAALLVSGSGAPSLAQTERPSPRSIVVTGVGEAKQAPDHAVIAYSARGEGAGPASALAAAVKSRVAIEAALRNLAGIAKLETVNRPPELSDVRGKDCKLPDDPFGEDREVLSRGDCAVVGVVATLGVTVRLWPADRAGDALSLAAEAGAKSPELRAWELDAEGKLRQAASAAAVANARAQALVLAEAAGVRLGEVLQITDGSPAGIEEIVVTAQRRGGADARSPAVPIEVTPEPITRTARATVTFALEP